MRRKSFFIRKMWLINFFFFNINNRIWRIYNLTFNVLCKLIVSFTKKYSPQLHVKLPFELIKPTNKLLFLYRTYTNITTHVQSKSGKVKLNCILKSNQIKENCFNQQTIYLNHKQVLRFFFYFSSICDFSSFYNFNRDLNIFYMKD